MLAVPLRSEVLLKWLRTQWPDVVAVGVGARHSLAGGVASPLVERVEVTATWPVRAHVRVDVVVKRCSPAEPIALREISSMPGLDTFPDLIDAGVDAAGPWLVTPYYPGTPMGWAAEPDPTVYADLARLHAAYLGGADLLPPELPRIDAAYCVNAIRHFASEGIRAARERGSHPVYDRALRLLPQWSADPAIAAGREQLPATLLHGDVYGLNVLRTADSGFRLIDWGCARVGPAMLDVAMAAGPDSAGLAAYLAAGRECAGAAPDPWLADVGHAWASMVCNATYVGAVADRFGPEPAVDMLDSAEAALARLNRLLRR